MASSIEDVSEETKTARLSTVAIAEMITTIKQYLREGKTHFDIESNAPIPNGFTKLFQSDLQKAFIPVEITLKSNYVLGVAVQKTLPSVKALFGLVRFAVIDEVDEAIAVGTIDNDSRDRFLEILTSIGLTFFYDTDSQKVYVYK